MDSRVEKALAEISKRLNEPKLYHENWYGGGMQDAVDIFLDHMAEPHKIMDQLLKTLEQARVTCQECQATFEAYKMEWDGHTLCKRTIPMLDESIAAIKGS